MGILKRAINGPLNILILIALLLLLISAGKSLYYTLKYGGTDLRCRIVGSRLLNTNESSYFFKWNNKADQRYLDPNDNPSRVVNGNVVTPALLLLNYPLSIFSYPTIRIFWTVLQYVFLGLTLIFLVKGSCSLKECIVPVLFIIIGYACSNNWLLNIERGQTYIFYTFIFSLILFIFNAKNNNSQFVAGLLTGMAVWIRPLMLCFNVPFLLTWSTRFITGSLIGMVAGFLVFFIPLKQTWKDYFNAMHYYELENLNVSTAMAVKNISLPNTIENSNNITVYKTDFITGGLNNIQSYGMRFGYSISGFVLVVIFIVLTFVLAFFFLKKVKRGFSTQTLFSFAFLLYILSELFIVGQRGPYNIIQWIPAVFLMIQKWQSDKIKMLWLITAVMFSNGFPFAFPFQFNIGELILLLLLGQYVFRSGEEEASEIA